MATWTASTRLRRAAAAVRTFDLTLMYMPMMPEAIEQAAPTRKATPVRMPELGAEDVGVGDVLRLDDRDDHADDDRATERQEGDRRVLAPDEGDRALVDGPGHVLHRLGARCRGDRTSRAR